ncbi:hypothetical protein M9434_000745 [Picochlorum sp. BPE23]|nr:hypothetical protein M9434_000745 [Picochlorum sp. BPE23]
MNIVFAASPNGTVSEFTTHSRVTRTTAPKGWVGQPPPKHRFEHSRRPERAWRGRNKVKINTIGATARETGVYAGSKATDAEVARLHEYRHKMQEHLAQMVALGDTAVKEETMERPFDIESMSRAGFAELLPGKNHTQAGQRAVIPMALGGHRGMGANIWSTNGPMKEKKHAWRYRENTISSFMAAAEAGATFIEFDVQVTADNHPVLFHDNYLVYGDSANPSSFLLKDLELVHFKGASPANSTIDGGSSCGMSDDEVSSTLPETWPMLGGGTNPSSDHDLSGNSPTSIFTKTDLCGGESPRTLLRQQKNGIVACPSDKSLSAWQVEEEDEFPTLLEVFEKLPPHIAFDIEIKMTTPDSVVQTPDEEISRVVNAIVHTLGAIETRIQLEGLPKRKIMFSSFDPDVCLRIKKHRPHDVVMFLSGGGVDAHADPRRTSMDAAIEFAASNNLQGIIVDSGALFADQGAVSRARARRLSVMTYGLENDDPLWVVRQKDLHVHGVIVDDVPRVARHFLGAP